MSKTKSPALAWAIAASLSLLALSGPSLAQTQVRDQTQDQTRERIYGSQLMTERERAEHRAALRSMKTMEEREAYRLEHHKKMQERAHERGVMLPATPPATGSKGGSGVGRGGIDSGGGRGR